MYGTLDDIEPSIPRLYMTPRWIRAALVICVLPLLAGCASTAARQTDLMERAGSNVSKRELQVLTHELVTRVTGVIEVTATHIYRNADDRQLRYRAAGWPTYAVPEFQWATLREDPLVGVARLLGAARDLKRSVPEAVVVSTGWTYLQEFVPHVAQACVREGWCDAVGLGRMALVYPDLPADLLAGRKPTRRRLCRTFSDCTSAPRNGLVSGCYPLDPFYRERPERRRVLALRQKVRAPTAETSVQTS